MIVVVVPFEFPTPESKFQFAQTKDNSRIIHCALQISFCSLFHVKRQESYFLFSLRFTWNSFIHCLFQQPNSRFWELLFRKQVCIAGREYP